MNIKAIAISAAVGAIDAKTVRVGDRVAGYVPGNSQTVAFAIAGILIARYGLKQSWPGSVATSLAYLGGYTVASQN